jgi:hypothetical protein
MYNALSGKYAGFEALMAVAMQSMIFLDVKLCGRAEVQ